MLSFSLLSLAIMLVTVVVMYIKFADASQDSIIESNHKVMDQTIDSVESYLVNMRQVSDSAYYNVIKENDILKQSDSIHKHHSHNNHYNKNKLLHIRHLIGKDGVWHHTYKLPACVADCIYHNLTMHSIQIIIIYTVLRLCRNLAVFRNISIKLYLMRMVNNIALCITQIIILSFSRCIYPLKHP